MIKRRKTRKIYVGNVAVGGDSPVTVQSMTNTKTADVKATVKQIHSLEKSGVDIIRVSCPDQASCLVLKEITKKVHVPVIADIHFDYRLAIEAARYGAACLRINPGNIGKEERVQEVVKAAKKYGCSMRIGVNAGSLEKKLLEKYGEPCADAMVESALQQVKMLEKYDFDQIKISVKSSDMLSTIEAYRKLSRSCDYPLHLGITEAGGLRSGVVKSTLGIGTLLLQGIGDTLRVSLSAEPCEEVKVGWEILKSLRLRTRGIDFISCPTCARKNIDVISIIQELEKKTTNITKPLKVAVMGCVVNGIGEAKKADIAVVGGDSKRSALYIDGKLVSKVDNEEIIKTLLHLIDEKMTNN